MTYPLGSLVFDVVVESGCDRRPVAAVRWRRHVRRLRRRPGRARRAWRLK